MLCLSDVALRCGAAIGPMQHPIVFESALLHTAFRILVFSGYVLFRCRIDGYSRIAELIASHHEEALLGNCPTPAYVAWLLASGISAQGDLFEVAYSLSTP